MSAVGDYSGRVFGSPSTASIDTVLAPAFEAGGGHELLNGLLVPFLMWSTHGADSKCTETKPAWFSRLPLCISLIVEPELLRVMG